MLKSTLARKKYTTVGCGGCGVVLVLVTGVHILTTKVCLFPPTRRDKIFPSLFYFKGKIQDYGPTNTGFTNSILENVLLRQN